MNVMQQGKSKSPTLMLPLVVLLLAGGVSFGEAAFDRITVTEGGINFRVDHYDNRASTPYRVIFWEKGVKSKYTFNAEGYVSIVKAGSEEYLIGYDSSDNLDSVTLSSSRRRNLIAEDEEAMEAAAEAAMSRRQRRLYTCTDCAEAWDAVCDAGVPSVCALVGYGDPILATGATSIQTFCDTFGAACTANTADDACAGQCEDDDDGTDVVISACLDPTSDGYRCIFDGDSTTLDVSGCEMIDTDGYYLQPCFEAFGKENIELLQVSFNDDLTTLPEGVFDGLTSLVHLDLAYNALASLPNGVFDGLVALETLSAHYNQMKQLPDGVFADNVNLQTLELTSGLLESLQEDTFAGLTQLYRLTLYLNELTTLPEGLFSGLTALQELGIGLNLLQSLPAGLFSGLTALDYLRIDFNELTTLPASLFDGLDNLVYLNVRSNPELQCLPDSSATEIYVGETATSTMSDPYGVYDGTCECTPVEAVTCDAGLSCQSGSTGYTCA